MNNHLLLQSKNDIPFVKAKLIIHQPVINDIAAIGEETFYTGCEILNFSKSLLSVEDRDNLKNVDDFDIFITLLNDKKTQGIQKMRVCALMVLTLIFPDYKMSLEKDNITFRSNKDENENEIKGKIDKNNFNDFKEIIVKMFCLKVSGEQEYNPINQRAKELAAKMQKGREQAAKAKGESAESISVLNRYISILSVGLQKDKNILMQYTVSQLFDEFERFELKQQYDLYVESKMAGAKNVKEVDNWMKELRPST